MQDAAYWTMREDGRVACGLCPHGCVLSEGEDGLCHVRGVRKGRLVALGYGVLSSAGVDPIEKKPLYHFRPGTGIFSIGGWGCNLRCSFCQNWEISQQFNETGTPLSPEDIVRNAHEARVSSIAYTYNEPLVGFEFVYDCAQLARECGLANVLVTNGFIQSKPAAEILSITDALNIDIKSFDESFYRGLCGAHRDPVLAFAEQAHRAGCHVEITNLLISGQNDSEEGVRAVAHWVRTHLADTVPLHLSAYFPRYKCDVPSTSLDVLERAYTIARQELLYVYLGNVHAASRGCNTTCPECGELLVTREGSRAQVRGIQDGRCRGCGRAADVVTEA